MEVRIGNSDSVISLFGYWPKFCDAKLYYFSFEENENGEECILMRLLYLDSDQSIGAKVCIFFSGLSNTNISNLFDENVFDELIIVKNDSDLSNRVVIQSCCGLSGSFSCELIEVKEVVEYDF